MSILLNNCLENNERVTRDMLMQLLQSEIEQYDSIKLRLKSDKYSSQEKNSMKNELAVFKLSQDYIVLLNTLIRINNCLNDKDIDGIKAIISKI